MTRVVKTILVAGFLLMGTSPVQAEILIFKSGKRIQVDQVWEQGDQIKCLMNGNTVGYLKDEIAGIEADPLSVGRSPKLMGGLPLGISHQRALNKLKTRFSLKPLDQVNGYPRYLARSSDQISAIELIGNPSDILQASFTLDLKAVDDNSQLASHMKLLKRFLRNLTRGKNLDDWLKNAFNELCRNPQNSFLTVQGNTHIQAAFEQDPRTEGVQMVTTVWQKRETF